MRGQRRVWQSGAAALSFFFARRRCEDLPRGGSKARSRVAGGSPAVVLLSPVGLSDSVVLRSRNGIVRFGT